jgi:hypothetical protein
MPRGEDLHQQADGRRGEHAVGPDHLWTAARRAILLRLALQAFIRDKTAAAGTA